MPNKINIKPSSLENYNDDNNKKRVLEKENKLIIPDFVKKFLPSATIQKLETCHSNSTKKIKIEEKSPDYKPSMTVTKKLQSLQSIDFKNKDKIVSDILIKFPELNIELQNPNENLNSLIKHILRIPKINSNSYRYSKKDTKLPYSFVVHGNEIFIEIKRTAEDKKNQGGESKFQRLIKITDGENIERRVGLKIRNQGIDSKEKMEELINKRMSTIQSLKEKKLDSNLVVLPESSISYETEKKKQLLTVFEDLGGEILDMGRKEKWDLPQTLDALIAAAHSVAKIHNEGYIHRDIKQSNFFGKIIPGKGLTVKLGDLNFLLTKEEAITSPFAGTATVISLDKFKKISSKEKTYNTEADDLYGLGMTMLTLLEGLNHLDIFEEGSKCLEQCNDLQFTNLCAIRADIIKKRELLYKLSILEQNLPTQKLEAEGIKSEKIQCICQLNYLKCFYISEIASVMESTNLKDSSKSKMFSFIRDLTAPVNSKQPSNAQEILARLVSIKNSLPLGATWK